MKSIVILGAFLTVCAPFPAALADAEPGATKPGDVIASLDGEWNGDGRKDHAALLVSEEGADLALYLSGSRNGGVPTVIARDIVWHGGDLMGQGAGLEESKGGGIVVTSQNTAIGRNRWNERLTLAYRQGAMRVAGYSRTAYDSLDLSWKQNCDINYLTGRGLLNEQPIQVKAGAPLVQDWSMENTPPEVCAVD